MESAGPSPTDLLPAEPAFPSWILIRSLLNPFRFPVFSWQLWSHKLLRYGSFASLAAGCLLVWTVAAEGPVYLLIAVGQVLFVGCVALGAWGPQVVAKLAGFMPLASSSYKLTHPLSQRVN